MKISLNRINEDYLFEATSSNGMNVLLDNKSKKEGKVEGISPMEVLLMGVAGCKGKVIKIETTKNAKLTRIGPSISSLLHPKIGFYDQTFECVDLD